MYSYVRTYVRPASLRKTPKVSKFTHTPCVGHIHFSKARFRVCLSKMVIYLGRNRTRIIKTALVTGGHLNIVQDDRSPDLLLLCALTQSFAVIFFLCSIYYLPIVCWMYSYKPKLTIALVGYLPGRARALSLSVASLIR